MIKEQVLEQPMIAEPMLPYTAVVREIKPEAYGISTFFLSPQDETRIVAPFQPGQFNMIHLPAFGEVAISISSDPAKPQLMGHTIRYAGGVTRALGRLKVGDTVGLRGPYGHGWPVEESRGKDLLIVTGGIGMAPLRPVILHAIRNRDAYGRVVVLYGGRTPQDLLYPDEFDSWRDGGVELYVSVDRADETWTGQVGVIPMAFYKIRLEHRNTVVFTCGPEIMMRFVIFEALARRIPKDAIYVSMERNMKCAVGVCGHCQLGPTFICKHGPVLKYASIEPFFGREDF